MLSQAKEIQPPAPIKSSPLGWNLEVDTAIPGGSCKCITSLHACSHFHGGCTRLIATTAQIRSSPGVHEFTAMRFEATSMALTRV